MSYLAFFSMLAISIVSPCFAAEQTENAQFKNWNKFKPGTMVRWHNVSTNGTIVNHLYITQKLLESNAERVIIETTISSVAEGNKIVDASSKEEITSKIDAKTPRTFISALPMPINEPKAVDDKQGEDELDVKGEKIKCRTVEASDKIQPDTTVTTKAWVSDDIPNGLIKYATTMSGKMKHESITTMTDYIAKK